MRKLFFWKLKQREIKLGERTVLLGVLNVTPDSFSDGGKYSDPDRAFARALELEEQGADIIDIGAESTKPGSTRIAAAEEMRRLIPVLKRLKDRLAVPISVDTYKAEVAERALELGVEIINDPSGLTYEPAARPRRFQSRRRPHRESYARPPGNVGETVPHAGPDGHRSRAISMRPSAARAASGVEKSRIVIDPGIGFGKRKEQNSLIIGSLHALDSLDLPIMVGPSRKNFLAHESVEETRFATAAAVTAAVLSGAHLVRVHDVREMRAATDVADEIVAQKLA